MSGAGAGVRFGRGIRNVLGALGIVLALGIALGNAGCAKNTGSHSNLIQDASAKPVRITPGTTSGHVSIDQTTVRISKSANERVQWNNETDQILFVAFDKAAVGLIIEPHGFSATTQVCKFCDAGGTSYPYKVFHKVGANWEQLTVDGPPTDPQVVVGD